MAIPAYSHIHIIFITSSSFAVLCMFVGGLIGGMFLLLFVFHLSFFGASTRQCFVNAACVVHLHLYI